MKLLGISLGAVLTALIIWASLWFWGQGQQYQAYDHPLLKMEFPLIALEADNVLATSEFIATHPKDGVLLKLFVSKDGRFFTAPEKSFDFLKNLKEKNPEQYKGNRHHLYDYDFLKSQSDTLVPLEAWMSLKPHFWIFDIQDNATDSDRYTIEWIEKNKMQDLVIIKSDVDLVVSSIKERQPHWIYGSTQSDLSKILTLASIHLESLSNFQRDFYFSPLKLYNRDVINVDVFKELQRRHKKIVLGPVHTDQDRDLALSYRPDILIVGSALFDKNNQ